MDEWTDVWMYKDVLIDWLIDGWMHACMSGIMAIHVDGQWNEQHHGA